MPQWTQDQQDVIGSSAGRFLCSAAAGNGKTAVMIERIVRLLREREDPDYLALIRRYEPAKARDLVTRLWHFIMSLPDPFGWLEEKTEDVPVEVDPGHPWFRTVSAMVEEKLAAFRVILRRQADMFDDCEKVAVTRAREKLCLVGTETDSSLWHLPPGDHRTLAAENYLDLIMPALLDEEKKSTGCSHASKP